MAARHQRLSNPESHTEITTPKYRGRVARILNFPIAFEGLIIPCWGHHLGTTSCWSWCAAEPCKDRTEAWSHTEQHIAKLLLTAPDIFLAGSTVPSPQEAWGSISAAQSALAEGNIDAFCRCKEKPIPACFTMHHCSPSSCHNTSLSLSQGLRWLQASSFYPSSGFSPRKSSSKCSS